MQNTIHKILSYHQKEVACIQVWIPVVVVLRNTEEVHLVHVQCQSGIESTQSTIWHRWLRTSAESRNMNLCCDCHRKHTVTPTLDIHAMNNSNKETSEMMIARRSANANCTALRMWNMKCTSVDGQILREWGHPLPKCWYCSIGIW